ncbi:MAG: glycosyltransferase family 4 protein [Lachnospiraceae bacterium]
MRKKKIAVCGSQVPFVKGGAELHVESLVQELRNRDYDVDTIQIPYKWYPNQQLLNTNFAWRMLDLSESNGQKIDLVIPTKTPSYMVKHDNKVVWLIHQFRQIYDQYGTQYSPFTEADRDLMEQLKEMDTTALKEAKKIYTNSQNTADRLMKYNHLEGCALYHPPKHYGKYYHENYGDYILSVGRLESIKRVDLLIEALKYTNKDVRAVIAGRGPYLETLEKMVEKNDLGDRVEFLGFVDDALLLNLYANARGVFFAPFDEDYGYITLEAFLSRVPVITTVDAGGVLEFVEDGKNGFVNPLNAEVIGKSIMQLADDKVCAELGNNGYKKVKDISWDIVIDKLTETIR